MFSFFLPKHVKHGLQFAKDARKILDYKRDLWSEETVSEFQREIAQLEAACKEKDAKKIRNIRVQRNDVTNVWNLNDMTWDDIVASGYKKVIADPALGDVEIWEIENKSGGWFHPLHIHLIDFKVLSRNGKAPFAWELGAKDVIYVGEAEKIRLLMQFGKKDDPDFGVQTGRYMIHCHNLVHEDHDMMSQFSVGLKQSDMDPDTNTNVPPIATDYNHPIKADPPYADNSAP